MIYEIVKSTENETVLVPQHSLDAWDCYNMLDKAFPYNQETYDSKYTLWDFHICCAGGYENGIIFPAYTNTN